MKHRLLVIGLPNTEVTKDYPSCAFTQKVLKFCKMMKDMDNEVILFAGGEKTEAPCDEFVSCISREDQKKHLGVDHYVKVSFDTSTPLWQIFNANLEREILKRRKPHDIICLCMGTVFKEVTDKVGNDALIVETGIGYSATFAPYQVFESYCQRHAVYAQNKDSSRADGRFYDEVIPNYFDENDFPFSSEKEDYLLYVGRMVQRKGLKIVEEIANRTKKRVILAGMGAKQIGNIIYAQDITIKGPTLEYIGEIDFKKRGELMSHARAVLCPTIYVEPFCGVNVEAQMCGTPVITTDWGAFTETVEENVTGFRCRTLSEFVNAVHEASELDYEFIRSRAVRKYSMSTIAIKYQEYFDRLETLWGKGWYTS